MPSSPAPPSDPPAFSESSRARRSRDQVRASPEQLAILRKSFEVNPAKPKQERLAALIKETGLTKIWIDAWFWRQRKAQAERSSSPAVASELDKEDIPPPKKQKTVSAVKSLDSKAQTNILDDIRVLELPDDHFASASAASSSKDTQAHFPVTSIQRKENSSRTDAQFSTAQAVRLNLAELLVSGQITGEAFDSLSSHLNIASGLPTNNTAIVARESIGPVATSNTQIPVKQEEPPQTFTALLDSWNVPPAHPQIRRSLAPADLNAKHGASLCAPGVTSGLANHGSLAMKNNISRASAARPITPWLETQSISQTAPYKPLQSNSFYQSAYGNPFGHTTQQPTVSTWFKTCPWSLPGMPPLDPEHAPLKYLKNVMKPYLNAPYPEQVSWDELVDKVLYGINVEENAMEAAMGLVFLRGIGFVWD